MAEEGWSCDERRVVSPDWGLVLDQAGSVWLLLLLLLLLLSEQMALD